MLDHGAKAPVGHSITSQLVGPIHTPMMGEDASLLGVLARAFASITPHRGLMWRRFISMAVDNDHARSEHLRPGSTPASHVWTGPLKSQANRT